MALEAWRESAHRQLIQALALSGQRNAALAQYENCRTTLAQELGLSQRGDDATARGRDCGADTFSDSLPVPPPSPIPQLYPTG